MYTLNQRMSIGAMEDDAPDTMVTINVCMGELNGAVVLAASTEISPAETFLNALGEADDFPEAIADAIVDADGKVILLVNVGGDTMLELSEALEQADDGSKVLSDIAQDGQVNVKIEAAHAAVLKLPVVSDDGTALGEVELPPDVAGTALLAALCARFTADDDMTSAKVEMPGKKAGKWLPVPEPFGEQALLERARVTAAGLLTFVRPAPPASIEQLRVQLPPAGALKLAGGGTQQAAAQALGGGMQAPLPTPAAAAAAAPAVSKREKEKQRIAAATSDKDAGKVAGAKCLQPEREQKLMACADGKSCITLLGGGKYKCNICDDTSLLPPAAQPREPRTLGEGCSGLQAHLISVGHIMLHAKSQGGGELSAAEIKAIRADGASKSYTDKRGAGSSRDTVAKLTKIAKLGKSGTLQVQPLPAQPPTTPIQFGMTMAAAINGQQVHAPALQAHMRSAARPQPASLTHRPPTCQASLSPLTPHSI